MPEVKLLHDLFYLFSFIQEPRLLFIINRLFKSRANLQEGTKVTSKHQVIARSGFQVVQQPKSLRIEDNQFLHNANQKQRTAGLIKLLHPLQMSECNQVHSHSMEKDQSHIQTACHQKKWTFDSDENKGPIFLQHYSHHPYQSVITNKKVKVTEQTALAVLGELAWW